ncbi:hypothetical protein JCM8547_001885 [Rhodosporidiobolus lusitaniae]
MISEDSVSCTPVEPTRVSETSSFCPLQVHLARISRCFPADPPGSSLAPHDSLNELLKLVDEQTRNDVRKFRFLRDARRCLLGRLLVRHILASRLSLPWNTLSFGKDEQGRPFAVCPSFDSPAAPRFDYSVSHDSDLVIVASLMNKPEQASRRIGADVMRIANPWEECTVAEFVEGIAEQLTPFERRQTLSHVDPSRQLFHVLALWTLKEAFTKATSEGLRFDLQRLEFDLHYPASSASPSLHIEAVRLDGKPLKGWEFELVELKPEVKQEKERYWLAVAVREGGDAVRKELGGGQEGLEVTEVGRSDILKTAKGKKAEGD